MANTSIPSYDFLLRGFYSSNRYARKSYNRASISSPELASVDSEALKKISENLRRLDYESTDSSNGENIFNNVKAFVETYNNLITSSDACDSDKLDRTLKKLKNYVKDKKSDLEEIGITYTSSGKLTLDENDLKSSSLKKVKRLFSDDNDFTSTVADFSKKLFRISKTVIIEAARQNNNDNSNASANPFSNLVQTVNQMDANGIDYLA